MADGQMTQAAKEGTKSVVRAGTGLRNTTISEVPKLGGPSMQQTSFD